MNLGEFIKQTCEGLMMVNEGIRNRDVEKAQQLMSRLLQKHKIYTIFGMQEFNIDGKRRYGVWCFTDNNEGALMLWNLADTSYIDSIVFTDDFDTAHVLSYGDSKTPFNANVHVTMNGANTIQACKLIISVLTGETPMKADDILSFIKDARIFESVVNESDAIAELKRKRNLLSTKISTYKRKGKDYTELQQQYDEIRAQYAEARAQVKPNVRVIPTVGADIEKYDDMFAEQERATPEERFEDMEAYISSVINGMRPLALICGAPGVGKSYRIKKAIEAAGKDLGADWKILKGRITPAALYTTLHDFKNAGQIMVMDDCDSVFRDENAINLLKAAYDSSDERWVTWNTQQKIPMPTEIAEMSDDAYFDSVSGRWYYPKEFLYEGSGIIATNFNVGAVDTAIRNRALICDLEFTVEEVLDILEKLAPKIDPGKYSDEAKAKAMAYLRRLADMNAPMEISIRSFTTCADLYNSDAPDKAVERRIREQMRNQFMKARSNSKY